MIDAGECVPRVNQAENSASVVEDDCVMRDDGFEHAFYAVAFDLDEHYRNATDIELRQPAAEQNQRRNALRAGILCRATIRMRTARQSVRSIA